MPAMGPFFPILDVSQWPVIGDEMIGPKPKFWLSSPDGSRWLYKEKSRQNSEDDWSEKIAAELAGLLGIPHSQVELARRHDQRGVVVRNLVPDSGEEELILGNSLLVEADSRYPMQDYYHVAQHTVDRVVNLLKLRSVGLPPGTTSGPGTTFGEEVTCGVGLFIGYLLFDAWIGNTDRHHENWAILKLSGGSYALSPSFDHAASMGHNLMEADRVGRLTTRDRNRTVTAYAGKARSAFFAQETDRKPISTDAAFLLAGKHNRSAAAFWMARLQIVRESDVTDILKRIPKELMSEETVRFVTEMLRANRQRLLTLPLG